MRLAIARTGLFVLPILLAGPARPAESSTITASMQYSTTGRVEASRIDGAPVLRFEGVDSGTLTTGGTSFDLGRFVVASTSANGSTTTYNGTPFEVTFNPRSVDGVPTPGAAPATVGGWLYGTVTGSDTSKLQASMVVNSNLDVEPYPSYVPPFAAGRLRIFLSSALFPAGGRPEGDPPGTIPIRSVIYATETVPEPRPALLFACLVAAIAFRQSRS